MTSEETLLEVISSFKCSKDVDIEGFLNNKAVLFNRKGKSRTHLLLNQDALETGSIEILAYFSLAIHMLKIPEGTSANQVRRLDGLYARKGSEPITEIPSFLIGQLAKNDTYASEISGSLLLEYALSDIASAQEIVGGRVAYIECRDTPKVISFYEQNGFKILRRDPDDGLIQMYCIIGK
jgi:hypothetical protein